MNEETEIRLLEQLKRHEGSKLTPYKCSAGKMTIGIGHNYQENPLLPDIAKYLRENGGITPAMEQRQFLRDKEDAEWLAFKYCEVYDKLDDVRQAVIINMIFNMGAGFLNPKNEDDYWPNFNKSLCAFDFEATARNMKYKKDGKSLSKWVKDVGDRAYELIEQMRTGKWRG